MTMSHKTPARPMPQLALLLVCALLMGCKIVILSGPTTVSVGDRITYELELTSDLSFGYTTFFVLAEIPVGWHLESSTYTAVVLGEPVSGNGVVVDASDCDFVLGKVRPGYQRLHIQNETPLEDAESAVATLELMVGGQPASEFNIYFVFGRGTDCSEPAVATINRQGPHFLTLVEALFDGTGGVDGLAGPGEIAASPDGRHLYVTGGIDKSVAAFSRDEASGELSFIEAVTHGVGGVDGLGMPVGVATSHDGEYLYVASLSDPVTSDQGGVAIFSRDPTTGELTFFRRLLEDVEKLAISPDDHFLYASSGGITVYWRDEASGDLTFVETVFPGGHLSLSPDGLNLYAAYRDGDHGFIAVYGRDELSGRLTLLDLTTLGEVAALSPDGRHLYAISGEVIHLIARDESTGLLSLAGTISDLAGAGIGISPESVVVNPDGRYVAVGGRLALSAFQRDSVTGELTFIDTFISTNLPVDELEGPRALAFAPSGPHLYAASLSDDALLVFDTSTLLFGDGFESGTTSAWSASVP